MISSLLLVIGLCYLPPIVSHFLLKSETWKHPKYLWTPILLHSLALLWIGLFQELWVSPTFGLALLSNIMFLSFQIFRRNSKMETLGVVHLPLGFLLLVFSMIVPNHQLTSSVSWWVVMHIILILVGFGFFALGFAQSLIFLFVHRRLKSKNLRGIVFFPSLERLDRLNHISSFIGFLSLSLGIVAGGFWSVNMQAWTWDLGSISSVALWLLYAISIHARLVFGRRMLWTAWFSVFGFGAMSLVISIASIFGVWHLEPQ